MACADDGDDDTVEYADAPDEHHEHDHDGDDGPMTCVDEFDPWEATYGGAWDEDGKPMAA